jgi:effector-binding domain-containing protein
VDHEVTRVEAPARPTAVVAQATTWDAYSKLWPSLLDQVYSVVRELDQKRWQNVMLYLDDQPSVEVGVLLEAPFDGDGRVVASELPAGPAATTVHRGSYAELGEAHEAVIAWCTAQDLERTGVRWEIYGHPDPDTDQVDVEIYWQLADT